MNKGFTLVEMLAVIVILGIVLTLSSVSIMAIRNSSYEKMLETKKSEIENAAIVYGQENPNSLTESCTVDGEEYSYCKVVSVWELFEGGYFTTTETDNDDNITVKNNVTGYDMFCDTVQIYRKNNQMYAIMLDVYSDESDCCSTESCASCSTYDCGE